MARPKKEKPLQHDHPVMVRYSDIEYELIKDYAEHPVIRLPFTSGNAL